MRFHIVSLPHTQVTRAYSWCAYTDKVRKFCDMMWSLGHEVYLYAGEDCEADVTELVTCVTKEEQAAWWPDWNPETDYWPDGWRVDAPWWTTMNSRAIEAIQERLEPKDFICIIAGYCQQSVADAFPKNIAVEWGIGYEGFFSKYRVFESYAWMHWLYGKRNIVNGVFYDTVIPNFFDPDDFPIWRRGHDDYLLYIGRLVERKGLEVVKEVVKNSDLPLKVAGQGDRRLLDGIDYEDLGVVAPLQRNRLMAGAMAVLVPTYYIEPFGGVAVEAQLCGTPVITTDFGAFSETVVHGETGFRCHTLHEFVTAVDKCETLRSGDIRRHAERYLTTNVRYEYEEHFERLLGLYKKGWYELG